MIVMLSGCKGCRFKAGGRSHKKHEDPPAGMYEEINVSGRGESVCRDRSIWCSVLSDYPGRDTV